jgi:hypothetical protein
MFRCFRKITKRNWFEYCIENTNFVKIWQERVRCMKTNTFVHLWYLAQFFLEWEMFKIKVAEEIKTHFMFNKFFLRKSSRLWCNVKNVLYPDRPHMAIQRMRFACWIFKNYTHTHTHTLRICDTYCSSTATLFMRMHVKETFICTLPFLFLTMAILVSQAKLFNEGADSEISRRGRHHHS